MVWENAEPDGTDYSAIWSCEEPKEFEDALEDVRFNINNGDYTVEDAMEELDVIAHDLTLSRELHPEFIDKLNRIKSSFTELRNSLFQ